MIIIVATLAQALSGQAPAIHIIDVLFLWRLIVSRDPHNPPLRICAEPQFSWVLV